MGTGIPVFIRSSGLDPHSPSDGGNNADADEEDDFLPLPSLYTHSPIKPADPRHSYQRFLAFFASVGNKNEADDGENKDEMDDGDGNTGEGNDEDEREGKGKG
jgi:hypothetical protein